uniref:Uncharacterized protein n=1 Tax=Rhizophora mucronata TaxID=61149 RepID=A0A2P2NRQ8_RHIMU
MSTLLDHKLSCCLSHEKTQMAEFLQSCCLRDQLFVIAKIHRQSFLVPRKTGWNGN